MAWQVLLPTAMNKWRILVIYLLLAASPVRAMPLLLFSNGHRFTEKQWRQLKPGMSFEEVTAILCCPPGDYTEGKGMYVGFCEEIHVSLVQWEFQKSWSSHHGAIGVFFDKEGKLSHTSFFFAVLEPPPTLGTKSRDCFR